MITKRFWATICSTRFFYIFFVFFVHIFFFGVVVDLFFLLSVGVGLVANEWFALQPKMMTSIRDWYFTGAIKFFFLSWVASRRRRLISSLCIINFAWLPCIPFSFCLLLFILGWRSGALPFHFNRVWGEKWANASNVSQYNVEDRGCIRKNDFLWNS